VLGLIILESEVGYIPRIESFPFDQLRGPFLQQLSRDDTVLVPVGRGTSLVKLLGFPGPRHDFEALKDFPQVELLVLGIHNPKDIISIGILLLMTEDLEKVVWVRTPPWDGLVLPLSVPYLGEELHLLVPLGLGFSQSLSLNFPCTLGPLRSVCLDDKRLIKLRLLSLHFFIQLLTFIVRELIEGAALIEVDHLPLVFLPLLLNSVDDGVVFLVNIDLLGIIKLLIAANSLRVFLLTQFKG